MSYRFYYYYHLERARFDDAIMLMERELFISGRKIADRLTENNELLKDITLNAPSHKQLKQRYPHFNWN
ncbi:hypothetical protein [Pedobacter suwonensis]|uniref:hypothetical protein n=1 Tax=Pedobacter suwonensis TaxID=332999 RepID=UPI00119F7AE6|nr:hypothetical protein [Pedobacter suwonensis]